MGFVVSGESSYSAAPFIVYRSEKYSGIKQRAFHYLTTYGRSYFIHPLILKIRKLIKNLLLQSIALIILLLVSPFLLASLAGLFVSRRFRVFLVRRFQPKSVICEDLRPRWSSGEEDEGEGMVTAVLWVKGQLDVQSLRSHLESQITSPQGKLGILGKILWSKYGLRTWEELSAFNIRNHVIKAPTKFYNSLITDETRELQGFFGGNSDKSVLQKYVTSRASVKLDEKLPPWQVTVIPIPPSSPTGINRIKTCVVLRFHRLLFQRPEVAQMFKYGLGQPNQLDILQDDEGNKSHEWISLVNPQTIQRPQQNLRDESSQISLQTQFKSWIYHNYRSVSSDLGIWMNLYKKQYEFHTKLAFLRCIFREISEQGERILKQLRQKIILLREISLEMMMNLRGIIFLPLFIISCFNIYNYNGKSNRSGFKRNEKRNTRHVSWSKPISIQLINDISKKTDNASQESILLIASSLALADYYSENCILNPESVGVLTTSAKIIDLPTRLYDVSSTIKRLSSELESFPGWKQRGLSLLHRFAPYFLPRPLAYLLYAKIFQRYPISFNFIDTNSEFPHLTLWGKTIEEFMFWKAPQSDFCVSMTVVKYAGTLRLSLISPMKCVDSAITQRYSQYLNGIAESVGVPRLRIPYSRKSSPSSSSASSPHQKRFILSELNGPPMMSNSIKLQKYNSTTSLYAGAT